MPIPDNYQYRMPELREAQLRGKAQEAATVVLRVLAARGIAVSNEVRGEISACTNLDQLHEWLDRASVATSIEEVMGSGLSRHG